MPKIRTGFIDVPSSSFLDTHFYFANYIQSTQYTQRQSQQQRGTGQRPEGLFFSDLYSGEDRILDFVREKNFRTSQVEVGLEYTKRFQ